MLRGVGLRVPALRTTKKPALLCPSAQDVLPAQLPLPSLPRATTGQEVSAGHSAAAGTGAPALKPLRKTPRFERGCLAEPAPTRLSAPALGVNNESTVNYLNKFALAGVAFPRGSDS